MRDASRDLADQARDGGGFMFVVDPHAKELVKSVDVHAAGNYVSMLPFAHDVSFVFVAQLADNLFNQVFDGDEAGNATVFVDDHRHANVISLHLAQQFAAALGLGDEKQL